MKKINVAIVGLGTVGKGVYDILTAQNFINKKSANKIQLVKVASRSKKDFVDVDFTDDVLSLANDEKIDVIIEVAGGDSGVILELWQQALKNGKKIISANKALIAKHGFKLAKIAEENGGYFAYEAAVAGSIPIVKLFKEGLAANEINAFCGILNGTANYILTKMKDENIDFSVALKQAQDAGYAEADPTFDIEGIDAAHKLAILSAIASSSKPQFDKQYIEGITKISIDDIKIADEFGYKIKLLGIFKNDKNSQEKAVWQSVYPALVKKDARIASVDDSFNAIFSQGSNCGDSFIVGRGAGEFPTASAIVADLIDIANDRMSFEFGVKTDDLSEIKIHNIENRIGRYFISLEIASENDLNPKFLKNIKAKKTYFYKNADKIICGLITEEISEKELKKQDFSFAKAYNLIRVEEF
jgi:homoserine dehydrogenase